MTTSKHLTIFEGPDGSGKTTIAKAYAELTGARYVHFGPMPHIGHGLARIYVEAMLPALLGHQSVVFDRCWLSEVPYGTVFREGQDRLGFEAVRMLERLAWRCGAVVVQCLPHWESVERSFISRKGDEYLNSVTQLRQVYDLYKRMHTDLNVLHYDYSVRVNSNVGQVAHDIELIRHPTHLLSTASAGNRLAKVALIGDTFAEQKKDDPFYQWPFASFSGSGCSWWLAQKLAAVGICEDQLFWCNADQPVFSTLILHDKKIIALGATAHEALSKAGLAHTFAPHPQAWKRFHHSEPYSLINLIKDAIREQ